MNAVLHSLFPAPRMAVEAAVFADTLDGLDVALYLVDADARLLHANTAGRAVLDAHDILCESCGHLAACDPTLNQTLRHVFAVAGHGHAIRDADGTAVPMIGKDGHRHVAHVLPLTPGTCRRASEPYRAVAALFVRKVALTIPPRPDVIRSAFRLTPTELRVLLAIVELGSIRDVATALGVAETTIKTHVSRLFEKTGATRQADLVKLVAGYAPPLRDFGIDRQHSGAWR
ncbi:helix-turn-helix transcriptional regulator [Bradyrhizobium sp.]|uniref:helix-turn-helix transcriptional regulator n=1 Tax=Bradyrhizobium sp. TaxID=376 RepID=UPI0039E255BF